ncbi:MAG: hypothetical protein M5U34_23785 [Chloroflexi bacterium]|nr:hypothetical protein [Chloroflexota bacterium]
MKGRFWAGVKGVCRRITAVEWLILGLLLPLALFPSPMRTLALLVIPLLWLVRWIATGHLAPPTPVDWSLWGLLLMVLVSQYATFDMAHSLVKIAGLVYGIALFYAVVQGWARRLPACGGGGGLIRPGAGTGGRQYGGLWLVWQCASIGAAAGPGSSVGDGIGSRRRGRQSESSGGGAVVADAVGGGPGAGGVGSFPGLARRFHWWGAGLLALLLTGTAVSLLAVLLLTRSRAGLAGLLSGAAADGAAGANGRLAQAHPHHNRHISGPVRRGRDGHRARCGDGRLL